MTDKPFGERISVEPSPTDMLIKRNAALEAQVADGRDFVAALMLAWRAGERAQDYTKLLDDAATFLRKEAGG